jgi:hypothetical protein
LGGTEFCNQIEDLSKIREGNSRQSKAIRGFRPQLWEENDITN